MLHNRHRSDYESDFQYYLRREINNTIPRYKLVYITPSGEWCYDEPNGDYILISVLATATDSSINALAISYIPHF